MKRLKDFLGTGFYSGLSPYAPGTAGSLAALLIIFGIIYLEVYLLLLLLMILAILISFWTAPHFEEEYGKDPQRMVIDEWAGQSLTFTAITFTGNIHSDIIILLAGFILFRIFDIIKPFGINKIQNKEGTIGILGDDLLAGLYALMCLKTLIFVWPNLFGMI
ncbi:phosphatidylglycerophosphatase A [Gracilimonas sp.]|uniref:phosphatidylglycerophosphatase A family protein n=1 Tax=Gracilimonas sp. TaxID=1974203 RepID=UPI002870ECF6|nr:phosphatidylglycerophosphatase A [Gracilimonas sp.]